MSVPLDFFLVKCRWVLMVKLSWVLFSSEK
jgi:hypothetical protein